VAVILIATGTGLFFIIKSSSANSAHTHDDDGYVYYCQHGAVGDGVADDFNAIIAAHAAANAANKPVKACQGATYKIGGAYKTAIIQTNTDWGDARFKVDDTNLEFNGSFGTIPIFQVTSKLSSYRLPATITSLPKTATNIGEPLEHDSMVWIRGRNSDINDFILVKKDGSIDPDTPLRWGYGSDQYFNGDPNPITNSSSISRVYPIDTEQLTLTGGKFTQVLAETRFGEAGWVAHKRNIRIERSNVLVEGIYADTENDTGLVGQSIGGVEHLFGIAPSDGFVFSYRCANVTVQNSTFTARKGTTGTYAVGANSVVNLSFINCDQTNDIFDDSYWSFLGSNWLINVLFDGCTTRNAGANHSGNYNSTVRNSVVTKYAGGSGNCAGTLLIENSVLYPDGYQLVNMDNRYPYGWDGDVIIRNCTWHTSRQSVRILAFTQSDSYTYDYSQRHIPTIWIDGLDIVSTDPKFNNVSIIFLNSTGISPIIPEKIYIRNLTYPNGKDFVKGNSSFLDDIEMIDLDKHELPDLIRSELELVQTLDENDYTEDTWTALQSAITFAQATVATPISTLYIQGPDPDRDNLKQAFADLTDAIEGLESKSPPENPPCDVCEKDPCECVTTSPCEICGKDPCECTEESGCPECGKYPCECEIPRKPSWLEKNKTALIITVPVVVITGICFVTVFVATRRRYRW